MVVCIPHQVRNDISLCKWFESPSAMLIYIFAAQGSTALDFLFIVNISCWCASFDTKGDNYFKRRE